MQDESVVRYRLVYWKSIFETNTFKKEEKMHLGGSVVSNHILENNAKLKWIFREDTVDELDNG